MIGYHPGYAGMFTKENAFGAITSGTRIRKINSEEGDSNPDGTGGVVLGSITTPDELRINFPDVPYLYFVEWDNHQKVAVACSAKKITTEQ